MQKFSQMPYERIDVEALKAKFTQLLDEFKAANDYPQAKEAFKKLEDLSTEMETGLSIAYVRNTIDTRDEFYDGEINFINQTMPGVSLMWQDFTKAFLDNPFLGEFEKEYGSMFIKNAKESLKLQKESAIPLQIKSSELEMEYQKAAAACTTTFMGEECNFYGLLKFMEDDDREVRKNAFKAWADLYASAAPTLDKVYIQLVDIRKQLAKELGFSDYIEMSYLSRGRYDYDKNDVERFRQQIVDVVVPVCVRLREEQRARIGVDKLHYYDENYMFTDGNAMPIGGQEELVAAASQMYRELSNETGEFFDFMTTYELFDLTTRPGKHLGGYCTSFPAYKAPFIFSNFNGTSADVDVLTHEAGHAFQAYVAMRCQEIEDNMGSTSEINEIHSMAMELFTYPWMEKFFGENADKYRYSHICDALFVLPYMCAADEFQHRVFELEDASDPMVFRAIWHELEAKYMPWRDYDGNEFLEGGGFWMQKQHIFLYPFYYIDYALAQIAVFDLYGQMKSDHKGAWERYITLCRAGGSKGYFELLGLAGIRIPFEDGAVKAAVENLTDVIGK